MASSLFSAVISAVDDEKQRVALKAAAVQQYRDVCLRIVSAAVLAEYIVRGVPYPRMLDSYEPDEDELRRQASDRLAHRKFRSATLFRVPAGEEYRIQLIRGQMSSEFAYVDFDPISLKTSIYVSSNRERDSIGPVEATEDNVVKAVEAIARLFVDPIAQLSRAAQSNHAVQSSRVVQLDGDDEG